MDTIINEKVRGLYGDRSWAKLHGLETVRLFVNGDYPRPPIHHLTGLTATEAGLGSMTFSMPITEWLQDATGIIWGGIYAFLVDAPISLSLVTGLPPGKAVTTSELSINYIRPPSLQAGILVGRGKAVYLGRDVGVAEATVEDGQGRTMAHATTRCVVLDVPIDAEAILPSPADPITDPPDPYLRTPPEGSVTGPEVWDGDRLSVQSRLVGGELPPGPVQLLTGMEFTNIDKACAQLTFPASPWFSAGSPFMYGGAIAMACDSALGGAVWSTLDSDAVAASMDLQVRFLRPVKLDGRKLTVSASVRHSGKTIRVAEAEVHDADGRRVALASGSSMVIPGGIEMLRQGISAEEIIRREGSGGSR
jgi:uncharacterized protein (TIGR00369 family)